MPSTSQGEKKRSASPSGRAASCSHRPGWRNGSRASHHPLGESYENDAVTAKERRASSSPRSPRRLARSLHQDHAGAGAVVFSITKILAIGSLDLPGTDHGVVGKPPTRPFARGPWDDADAFMSMETRTPTLLGGAWAVLLFGSGTSRDQARWGRWMI